MSRFVVPTTAFRKDYKRLSRSGRFNMGELQTMIDLLKDDLSMSAKYKDHALTGEYNDCRDCHIRPDWLLIYQKPDKETLILVRTGSHAELFG